MAKFSLKLTKRYLRDLKNELPTVILEIRI